MSQRRTYSSSSQLIKHQRMLTFVLDGHHTSDCRVVLVVHEFEIFELVVEDRVGCPTDLKLRVRVRHSRELLPHLLFVVAVDVAVTTCPYKITRFEAGLLGDHNGQHRIGRNVERHAYEHIGASLVQLARQFPVCHVELEERVTGRKCHAADLCWVPGGHDVPT